MMRDISSLDSLFRREALNFPKYLLNEPDAACRLHQNEMLAFDSADSEELARELLRALGGGRGMNIYPSLEPRQLARAFASSLGVAEENIEVTAGSSQALTLLAEALFEKGRKVAITSPSFSLYGNLARLYGSDVVDIRLDEKFEFSPNQLFSDEVLSAHVAILCTPNNPTGTTLSYETIVEFAEHFQGVVVIDEAYFEFFAEQGGRSCVSLATQRKNVIVLRTLSKAWAAAGLRVGAMVGDPEVIEIFRALKPPYSVAWPSEIMSAYILAEKHQETTARVRLVVDQVRQLKAILQGCAGIEVLSDSKANFVFFKTQRAEKLENELNRQGFLIRRYASGALAQCVRISMPSPEKFEVLTTTLMQVLS